MDKIKISKDFILTRENYFSPEAEMKFFGSTQVKRFMECEACALATINGEWDEKKSTALLVGGYVDAHFEASLDLYISKNPEMLKKDGTLKSEFLQANEIIARAERDELFMSFMSGEKQVIQTGKIGGHLFKTRIDSFFDDKLVDLKIMRDFQPIWKDGKRMYFIEAWGYDIQSAIYQAVDAYLFGSRKPFFIAGLTKEPVTDMAIFQIPQEIMDNALMQVEESLDRFADIKLGVLAPVRCGSCDYCKSIRVLTEDSIIRDYRNIFI